MGYDRLQQNRTSRHTAVHGDGNSKSRENKDLGIKSPFLELAAEKKELLLPLSRIENYPAGETIVEYGDPAENFFLIEDGFVRLLLASACGGKSSTIDVVGPGGAFGEAAATNTGRYEFTCVALDDVELRVIPGEVLRKILSEDPELVFRMMGRLSVNMHSLMSQIADLKMRTTAERLAMFLIELAGQVEGTAKIVLPYDKRIVAEKLGMTPETLSRTFAKLRKIGIKTGAGNQIEVDDMEKLVDYCGYPVGIGPLDLGEV
ncbi:Crp/Fnr family transcriptional regulator [Kiloniella laminariae]|uniref:Crp/Fnr family transcriptional regulator n=1 Tax=Kiloniella laminariae TaxID=454162 RepID=UPI00037CFC21|nr:Crp/Fnr family transcriptional regulator [Kiloniella laminariae]